MLLSQSGFSPGACRMSSHCYLRAMPCTAKLGLLQLSLMVRHCRLEQRALRCMCVGTAMRHLGGVPMVKNPPVVIVCCGCCIRPQGGMQRSGGVLRESDAEKWQHVCSAHCCRVPGVWCMAVLQLQTLCVAAMQAATHIYLVAPVCAE